MLLWCLHGLVIATILLEKYISVSTWQCKRLCHIPVYSPHVTFVLERQYVPRKFLDLCKMKLGEQRCIKP